MDMEGLFSSERLLIYRNVLSVLGAAYVLKKLVGFVWSISGGFCTYFLAPWGVSRIDLTKHGSWAIVTGASEGIGRAYALELAKQGLNVVIMSRSEEKLKIVADEIRERYGKDVRYFSVDFSKGQSVYDDIQAEISDLDVAVLVNNVGLANTFPNFTGELDEIRHRDMIELNCQSMVQMTHLVLPKMVEKKCGIIVNVSSMASFRPIPLTNVYSATKIFVKYFTDGLRYEYKSKGIIVQGVYPGFVATAMSGIKHPKFWAPSPERYVRSAVATIGIQNSTYGYLIHAIQMYIMLMLPEAVITRILYSLYTRKREQGLKKYSKGTKKD